MAAINLAKTSQDLFLKVLPIKEKLGKNNDDNNESKSN